MKKFFLADTGSLKDRFFVYVGFTEKEIINHPKTDKRVAEYFRKEDVDFRKFNGMVIRTDDFMVMWLNKNFNLYTLVHEITHVVDKQLKEIGAEKEEELRAYQTEYLLRQLIKKIFVKSEIIVKI